MDKIEKRKLIAVYLIIFILACLVQYLYTGFKYPVNLPKLSFNYVVYSRFFIWQPRDYSGILTYTDSVVGMLFDLPIVMVNLLFGLRAGIFISGVITKFIAAAGGFTLVYYLTSYMRNRDNEIRIVISFIPVILFIFDFVFQYISEVEFLFWALLFIILFLSKIGKPGKEIYIYAFLSVLFVSLDLRFSWPLLFVQTAAIILFVSIIIILLEKISFKKSIPLIFIILLLSLFIDLPLIYSGYALTNTTFYLNNIAKTNINYVVHNTINQNIILALTGFIPPNGINARALYILGLTVILIILVSNTLIRIRSPDKNLFNDMVLGFALFLTLVFIIFLSSLYFLPLGVLFTKIISIFYLFDLPWLNDGIVFALIIILLPLALARFFNNFKKQTIVNVFCMVISVAIIGLFVYYLFFIPYLKGNPTGAANIMGPRGINIPQHVFQISDFINSDIGSYSVLTLPQSARGGYNGWQFDIWYNGTNIYTSLISHPVYCGFQCYNQYSQEFFPPSELESYEANKKIENTIVNQSISNTMGVFGIKYIIVEGDTLHSPPGQYKEYFAAPNFNLTTIYKNLGKSKYIIFIKKYGNSSIYENLNYVPLVYTSNIDSMGNQSMHLILNQIENKSFRIQNNSVFVSFISGFYNDSNTINATPITNFSEPNISFVENTPTKVTVHVSNAITPYYLVFRETYDPHWAAFYSNGTEVNPRDHIAVNGFANAWYMNKTGNYTVTLYYTLQTDAWIAWAVSFAALFVTVGIGVYGWKEMKKEKMRSRR